MTAALMHMLRGMHFRLPNLVPGDPVGSERDGVERYRRMAGLDLPAEQRLKQARELSQGARDCAAPDPVTGLLEWRPAKNGDREDLKAFCCTEKPKRDPLRGWQSVHPRVWEYDAQCMIRDLRPPCDWPECVIVGLDGKGVAAVCRYDELDGPAWVDIVVTGIALRHRRKGGGVADELAREVQSSITDRAIHREISEVRVTARVYELNEPSQMWCRRFGMLHTGWAGNGVQVWSATVPIPLGE